METEKGDSWKGEGETPESPKRHEALMHAGGTRGASSRVSAQALHTSIVVTEAHELNSPPPTGEEGGCWSCHLLSFLPPPSNPQRTFLYLEGTVL